jgi:hypothetical protein
MCKAEFSDRRTTTASPAVIPPTTMEVKLWPTNDSIFLREPNFDERELGETAHTMCKQGTAPSSDRLDDGASISSLSLLSQ